VAESFSPLRYPGGKQVLARVLGHLIRLNGREGGTYVEPYAGGAGAALSLLYGEYVKRIVINDADSRIHAFWDGVVNRTNQFLKLLRDTPLSVDEWKRQREIYLKPARYSRLRVGFATFYLNRCNRSGIIGNGGIIGGLDQTGKWKIDARFNRNDLARRIERVARYSERITLSNLDAMELLQSSLPKPSLVDRAFVYLDPPYYCKGSQLYFNHYTVDDHVSFARYLSTTTFIWVMSYDNVSEIHKLYSSYRQVSFNLGYSARAWRIGKELLIIPDYVQFPSAWQKRIPNRFITSADRIRSLMPTEVRFGKVSH
jgi:DNA adenine methylase